MNRPFCAWKEGVRFYLPVIAVGLAFLGLDWVTTFAWWPVGLVVLLAGLCMLLFFRDPVRRYDGPPEDLVSPADGKVVGVDRLPDSPYYNGPCLRIAIFLSVLNVHVNRAPTAGRVVGKTYREGLYLNALKDESSEQNESNCVHMDTPCGPVTVRQISGAIARRIVCLCEAGDQLERGERFGMIRFGSRTELFVPEKAEACVTIGESVRAGTTRIARFATHHECKNQAQ